MEDKITYLFLVFALIISTLILNIGIANLDTSAWSFYGSSFAVAIVPYIPFVPLVIGVGVLAYKLIEDWQS